MNSQVRDHLFVWVLSAASVLPVSTLAVEPDKNTATATMLPSSQLPGLDDPHEMQFKTIGCKGMWPLGKLPTEPIIAIHRLEGAVTFSVRNPQSCGLGARKPTYEVDGNAVKLGYEVFADGMVASCLCDFHSEFTLSNLRSQNLNATFTMHFAPQIDANSPVRSGADPTKTTQD